MKKIIMYGKYGNGKLVLMDDDDYKKYGKIKWHVNKYGYAVHSVKIKGTKRVIAKFLSRIIMNCSNGMEVDHINHIRLDNKKSNLRVVNHSENCRNRIPKASGFVGIDYRNLYDKWRVRFQYKNIKHNLGSYYSFEDAKRAYETGIKGLIP